MSRDCATGSRVIYAVDHTRISSAGNVVNAVGNTVYSELPKVMLTLVVEDGKVEAALAAIQSSAGTGQHGDGKIFVTSVDAVYTVRTGRKMED